MWVCCLRFRFVFTVRCVCANFASSVILLVTQQVVVFENPVADYDNTKSNATKQAEPPRKKRTKQVGLIYFNCCIAITASVVLTYAVFSRHRLIKRAH